MLDSVKIDKELLEENIQLKRKLDEANAIISAISNGEVDAFLVPNEEGNKVYVLEGADHVYRLLVEEMHEGCLTVAQDGTILFSNKNFAEIVKVPLQYLTGQSIYEFLSPNDQEFVNALFDLSHDHFKTELYLKRKNGINVPVLISASCCHIDGETFICMAVTDLSELKRTHQLNSLVFDQAASPIIVCDHIGRVIIQNPASEKLFKKDLTNQVFDRAVPLYNELTGKRFLVQEAIKKGPVRAVEVVFNNNIHLMINVVYLHSDNSLYIEKDNVGFIINIVDVTENRQYREEIRKLDRLNLVGQMAAGIGHEIRNPLTTIRGYLQLLEGQQEFISKKSTFELMISELDRANSIITEFLALAREKKSRLKLQDLNSIMEKLYPLIEADTFTRNKQICLSLGDIPPVKLNDKEIFQLILNLTRNGLEAMEDNGCLTIKTYVEYDYVVLAVQDEGHGISPENISKLGIPFFTTKSQGTGLGLATCYQIAAAHNASIDVTSNSSGTTFYVKFPCS